MIGADSPVSCFPISSSNQVGLCSPGSTRNRAATLMLLEA
jgi:hypothetical protein